MTNKIVSVPSIQENLQQLPSREQYINNLKSQCKMQEQAFHVAENLITTYKQENQTLRDQIKMLKECLQIRDLKIVQYQQENTIIKTLEKNILGYSEKVNHLLQENLQYQHKIRELERQLHQTKINFDQDRLVIKEKLLRQKRVESQKKQIQSQFQNFLKLPSQDSPQNSPKPNRSIGKQSLITAVTKDGREKNENGVKVLEWKLKQKDEEIVILLKRLKNIEEKGQKLPPHSRRQRIFTADSFEHFNQSKKNHISEFTH